MDTQALVALVAVLAGGAGAVIKALMDRQGVKSKAGMDDASATTALTSAARELIDPLRQELATERAEHDAEIIELRAKARLLNRDLDAIHDHVRQLRDDLSKAWKENAALRAELLKSKHAR